MRAVVLPRFGDPSVLEIRDVPRPTPASGQVVVRILASGTNPVEAKIRAAGSWARIPLPAVLGYDAAGVVEEIGPDVTDLAVGDEVWYTPEIFGNPHGTHAEFGVVPANIVGKKPRALDFNEAASVPLAGGTAYEAIVRRLAVQRGETVLIHGGAGGVGTFAVQLAKALGARVLATAGSGNQALLRELGADVPIDYTSSNPATVALKETNGAGVDAVFDCVGGELVARSLQATRPFGRLATILPPQGDLTALYLRNQTLHGVFLTRERARLDELVPFFEDRRVITVVDEVKPLAGVVDAHRRLDSGHGRGKVVLTPAGA